MPFKKLSYGSQDDTELFRTDRVYNDGEQRWAARSNWFIRFWGYVFTKIARASTVDPGTGRVLLFIDSDNDTLTLREGDVYKEVPDFSKVNANMKSYNWFMS